MRIRAEMVMLVAVVRMRRVGKGCVGAYRVSSADEFIDIHNNLFSHGWLRHLGAKSARTRALHDENCTSR